MGVDATAVEMYGVKFDPNEGDLRDLIEAIYEMNDHDLMVYDGMCGTYLCLGHIFAHQDAYSGDDFVEIDVSDLNKVQENYLRDFKAGYPEWSNIFDGKEFKLLSFVHYS